MPEVVRWTDASRPDANPARSPPLPAPARWIQSRLPRPVVRRASDPADWRLPAVRPLALAESFGAERVERDAVRPGRPAAMDGGGPTGCSEPSPDGEASVPRRTPRAELRAGRPRRSLRA